MSTTDEVMRLRQEVDRLTRQQEEAQRESRQLQQEADDKTVLEVLETAGVKGARAKAALHFLRGEKLVRRTDDGLVFGENELPLGDGIAEFLKEDDAKVFLPTKRENHPRKPSDTDLIYDHVAGGRDPTPKADGNLGVMLDWIRGR